MQNTSHAVMSQRTEAKDSPDDFPTPPWATRALLEYVVGNKKVTSAQTCLEPACGAGHMVKVLSEYFEHVDSSDAYNYGFGVVRDFVAAPYSVGSYDWVITNPPFRLAEEFLVQALAVARVGVAILARTVFLESAGRYHAIFRETPPNKFAQFVERVPMVKGRLDRKASTATGYAWFVWRKNICEPSQLVWISSPDELSAIDADTKAIRTSLRQMKETLKTSQIEITMSMRRGDPDVAKGRTMKIAKWFLEQLGQEKGGVSRVGAKVIVPGEDDTELLNLIEAHTRKRSARTRPAFNLSQPSLLGTGSSK